MTESYTPERDELQVESFGYKQELKRMLTLRDLVVFALSMAVPIAPAIVYGYVVSTSKGHVALAYLIAAIGMLFTANSYARMSLAFPLAGGAYAYASKGINNSIGFMVGWTLIGMYMLILPLVYIFGAYALYAIIPSIPIYIWILVFISINFCIAYRGMTVTEKTIKYVLYFELLIYFWFLVACILTVSHGPSSTGFTLSPLYNKSEFSLGSVMVAVSIVLFNFGGPDSVTTLAEDTKGGVKTIGVGVFLGWAAIGAMFFLLTYMAALVWPDYATLGDPNIAFYEIAARAGGPALKFMYAVAIVIAVAFGCSICVQACSSRVLYAMARDSMLPKVFSKIHPKYQSPYISVMFVSLISVLLCFLFEAKADQLTSILNFNILISWLSVSLTTVYYYMLKKKSKNFFKDLICPSIAITIVGYAFISLEVTAKVLGFVWMGAGVLFMCYLKYIKKVDISFSSELS